jgi:hypothetical protein
LTEKIYLTEKWIVTNEEFRISKFNTEILKRFLRLIEKAEETGKDIKFIITISKSKIDTKLVQKDF